MYTPNLFPNELFKLWNNDDSSKLKCLRQFKNLDHNFNMNNWLNIGQERVSNFCELNDLKVEKKRKHYQLLFAPPLSSYSAESPGPTLIQLDYMIQTAFCVPGIKSSLPIFMTTPLIQKKLKLMQQVRNTGYSTIKPLGIEKTLQKLDFEKFKNTNTRSNTIEGFDRNFDPTNTNNTISYFNSNNQTNYLENSFNDNLQNIENDSNVMIDVSFTNENNFEYDSEDNYEEQHDDQILTNNKKNESFSFENEGDKGLNDDSDSLNQITMNSICSLSTVLSSNSKLSCLTSATNPTSMSSNSKSSCFSTATNPTIVPNWIYSPNINEKKHVLCNNSFDISTVLEVEEVNDETKNSTCKNIETNE